MYSHNQHSGMNRFRTEQHVSLDKHQQMLNNTMKWQEHTRFEEIEVQPKRKSIPQRVKRVALAIAQLLVK